MESTQQNSMVLAFRQYMHKGDWARTNPSFCESLYGMPTHELSIIVRRKAGLDSWSCRAVSWTRCSAACARAVALRTTP